MQITNYKFSHFFLQVNPIIRSLKKRNKKVVVLKETSNNFQQQEVQTMAKTR